MASPLPRLLELKVDTDKNKEDNENKSCCTINHDGIFWLANILYFCFDLVYLTDLV